MIAYPIALILSILGLSIITTRFIKKMKSEEDSVIAVDLEKKIVIAKQTVHREKQKGEREVSLFYAEAQKLIKRGKYDEAKSKLTKIIQLDDSYAPALISLGAILKKDQDFDMALGVLNKAHKLTPLDPKILSEIGEIYYLKKDYDSAVGPLEHSLALDNNSKPTHLILAKSYEALGKDKKAKDEYEKSRNS